MEVMIYAIIIVLYAVLLVWTWNNSKEFENTEKRVIYIIAGIAILGIFTFILFNISKMGVEYPSDEIMKEVRKISVLLFVPVNGFLSLPHIANLKIDVELGADDEKTKKKIIILSIIFIVAVILEVIYMKDFQNGIITILNSR